MNKLHDLPDGKLIRKLLRAEMQEDRWYFRAERTCPGSPRWQDATHLHLMWKHIARRLQTECDRRGFNSMQDVEERAWIKQRKEEKNDG
jgi:hypothetical protein